MSDARIAASLDALEKLLGTLMDDPDGKAVAEWHASFKDALAGAEKGPQWPDLSARARLLGERLDERVSQLQALRGAIRQELQAREQGRRALSGYRPS